MLIKTIQSSSSTRTYELRFGDDGRVYCTCPAWKFQHGKGGMCKHVKQYMADLAVGLGAGKGVVPVAPAAPTVKTNQDVRLQTGKSRRITPKKSEGAKHGDTGSAGG